MIILRIAAYRDFLCVVLTTKIPLWLLSGAPITSSRFQCSQHTESKSCKAKLQAQGGRSLGHGWVTSQSHTSPESLCKGPLQTVSVSLWTEHFNTLTGLIWNIDPIYNQTTHWNLHLCSVGPLIYLIIVISLEIRHTIVKPPVDCTHVADVSLHRVQLVFLQNWSAQVKKHYRNSTV